MCKHASSVVLAVSLLFALTNASAASESDPAGAAFDRGQYQQAFEIWNQAAEEGEPKALWWSAALMLNGLGTDQDIELGTKRLIRAMELGFDGLWIFKDVKSWVDYAVRRRDCRLFHVVTYGIGIRHDLYGLHCAGLRGEEDEKDPKMAPLGQAEIPGDWLPVESIPAQAELEEVIGSQDQLTDPEFTTNRYIDAMPIKYNELLMATPGYPFKDLCFSEDRPLPAVGPVDRQEYERRLKDLGIDPLGLEECGDDWFAYSPLMKAISRFDRSAIAELLEQQVDLAYVARDGHSAVTLAAQKGRSSLTLMLLKRGAPAIPVFEEGADQPAVEENRCG